MPIEVRDLRGLDGPNIYYNQPAMKLQTWSDRDIRDDLSRTIKQWAQMTGTVIGYLQQNMQSEHDGYLITTTFTTPFPNVGERILEGVIADLQMAENADTEYSHDELLFDVIELRKREEPPLPLLRLYAEARARSLPFLPREDGKLMIGSGSRGFVCNPSALSLGMDIEVPWDTLDRIPVIAVTGTNGKTTTVRLCAHILTSIGARVGWTDTDGITIGGVVVEEGDWAGFGGARRVLSDPSVDVAVLETSRGGILRRGLGFDQCDVSIITNVSEDHLGEFDITTLDDLARVKGIIAQVTHPEGRVILNAGDKHVAALHQQLKTPVMWFTRDAAQPLVQEHLAHGGDAVWSDETHIYVHWQGTEQSFPLDSVPIVVGGAATHNVENVLAATAGCVALGIDVPTIADALTTFTASVQHNSGRLNIFESHGIVAVLDYAHNVAGVKSLIEFGRRLRKDASNKLIVLIGGPGDRPDDQIEAQGRVAGAAATWLLIHEESRYLRGRQPGVMTALYRAGALEAGGVASDKILEFPDEVQALERAFELAEPGDIILAAAHAQRAEFISRLQTWATD